MRSHISLLQVRPIIDYCEAHVKVERKKQRARGRNSRVKQEKAGKKTQRSTTFRVI